MSITGAIGAGASLLGGIFGASSSSKASQEEQQGMQQAQQQLGTSETQALAGVQPYQAAGTAASGTLSQMLSTPGQGLLANFSGNFKAPTAAQAAATPGYQFQLQQGENAMQNSAAAQGGLLSGGTLAGMNNYAQGVASTNYQNTFSNAQTQYQDAYQKFLNNQQNQYNMLAGQSAQGLSAANAAGNITTGMGGDIASLYGQEGAAKAQGTMGVSNAVTGALGGMSNMAMLSNMGGSGLSFGSATPNTGSMDSAAGYSPMASLAPTVYGQQ
jgi:hypothetical protein